MSPDSVLQYLRENPAFLETHATALAQINIPHPETGRAISINERQLLSLRDRCRLLEGQLAEWIQVGRANDERGERMHRLVMRVLAATPEDRLGVLLIGLRNDFDIPWVHLTDGTGLPLSELLPADSIGPLCGAIDDASREVLTELAGQPLASLARVPVATTSGLRVLLLGSPDSTRFGADAGTQYLERVGEMLRVVLDGDA